MMSRSSAELTSTPLVTCVDHPSSKACPETVGVSSMIRIGIRSTIPVEFLKLATYDGRIRITVYVRRDEVL